MIPSAPTFACRYDYTMGTETHTLYFIIEDLDVAWVEGVPEVVDCQSIDIVAVV